VTTRPPALRVKTSLGKDSVGVDGVDGRLVVTVSPGRKVVAVAVPWVFLAAFATLYVLLALPRLREGQFLALCLGAFIGMAFVVFTVAAVTFSRDVLLDRWPDHTR